jgi:hypothetical protein
MSEGVCKKCGQRGYIMPLHGDKGGPLFCPFCIGQWQGEFGKKMKWRRVLMKAMAAYQKAGGDLYKDFNTMKTSVTLRWFGGTPSPGFSVEHIPNEFPDLTSELLSATLQLVHPDKHPPERQGLAKQVTTDLLALKPYVFPAPKPEPPPVYKASGDACVKKPRREPSEPSKPPYPCELCEGTVPANYCKVCEAERERRQEERRERKEQKRIERNAKARRRYAWRKPKPGLTFCSNCAGEFRAKRQDAKYCSASCRQKAYLARDGKPSNSRPLDRDEIKRTIEAVFASEPDWAFTTDEICSRVFPDVPKRKHRTAVMAACKAAGLGIFFSETRGGTRVIFKLDSLMGYAVARKRAHFWMLRSKAERIKAELAPDGRDHHRIAEGGPWFRHWQMLVAEAKGETDTPHYRKLAAEQRAAWGTP